MDSFEAKSKPSPAPGGGTEPPVPEGPQALDPGMLRILDVNANRAAEGLRVIEDYLRFVRDDRPRAESAKRLRHQLADSLAVIPAETLILARDARGDVGRTIDGPHEFVRPSGQSVVRASFKRSQQALRNLEEWSKLAGGPAAREFKALRYGLYELETAVAAGEQAEARLRDVPLCVLIDGGSSEADFVRRASALVEAGVPMIQLRAKQLDDRTLLQRGSRLMELTHGRATLVIVNDRTDVAAAISAHGVHLGQEDLPVASARRILGPERLIGVSTHSIQQARDAVNEGASYLGVGPVFESRTKTFDGFPGPALLRQVAAEIRLPAFAIGGIDCERLPQILECGMRRVAVGAAVWQAPSPGEACRDLMRQLAAAAERPTSVDEPTSRTGAARSDETAGDVTG